MEINHDHEEEGIATHDDQRQSTTDTNTHRLRKKLSAYKTRSTLLKTNITHLQTQLATTTSELQSLDARSRLHIDAAHMQISECKSSVYSLAAASGIEHTRQAMTVRILGEKLVKQAKVIRTQREAARAHKALLEALREEMAMQDERDRERDEEVEELHSQIRISNSTKVKVHRELMENHELMTDLRADNVEAQRKMEELEEGFERVKEELEVARRLGLEREERMGHVEARGDERKAERDELAARLTGSQGFVGGAEGGNGHAGREGSRAG